MNCRLAHYSDADIANVVRVGPVRARYPVL